MGQTSSCENLLSEGVDNIHDFVRHAHTIKQMASLTYEDFQAYLSQLNYLSRDFVDKDGKRLVFAVKKGTDSTMLWKGTVRIACVKIDVKTKKVESHRLLTLKQFLQVFRTLQCQAGAHQGTYKESDTASSCQCSGEESESNCNSAPPQRNQFVFSTSAFFLEEVEAVCMQKPVGENLDECCICLERRPEVILPCAHSYCLPCIEQWNVGHKTCPICREQLESTDDTWVISDAPDSEEVSMEIQKSLMGLASQN